MQAVLELPRRVKYRFTKAYQAADHTVGDWVHHSWIAQELERVVPRVVRRVVKTVNGTRMEDLRQVLSHHLVAPAVGAIKALHLREGALRAEHEALKAAHEALHKRMERLERKVGKQ